MNKIGIDKINFFTPHLALNMKELAKARKEDPDKYLIGLGQEIMAVIPNTQDTISMAANAADKIINEDNRDKIKLIIFATESGVDNSKSAGVYIQKLLNLPPDIRVIELKEACYAATAGIQLAKDYLSNHSEEQVLLIASDIARYGLNTPGETTQGGGSVAMILKENPQIATISEETKYVSQDLMDFWRPLYSDIAYADGHYSTKVYLEFFKYLWKEFCKEYNENINDFKAMIFHLPFTKLGLKALRLALPTDNDDKKEQLLNDFECARLWNKQIGNLYTGSVYLSLISLLANSSDLHSNDAIGIYSYGSGAEGEFYKINLANNFKQDNFKAIKKMIDNRTIISVDEYEKIFNSTVTTEKNIQLDIDKDPAKFVFAGIKNEQRQYTKH